MKTAKELVVDRNRPYLSRAVDPPRTKGGPHFCRGPPKKHLWSGVELQPGTKGFWSRLVAGLGTWGEGGSLVPGEATTHPGPKGLPLYNPALSPPPALSRILDFDLVLCRRRRLCAIVVDSSWWYSVP